MVLYRAFAAELDRRGEEHEFLFVFDGGFVAPAGAGRSRAGPTTSVRLLSFARTFGETAALRLGIERSRGDVIVTLPAYFQVQPEGMGPLLDALQAGADLVVANRSPRVDSWLNRLQSRGFPPDARRRDRPPVPRHRAAACGSCAAPSRRRLPLYGDLHRFIPALALREGYRVDEVPVPQHPNDARTRVYGPGSISAGCWTSRRSSSSPSSPRSRSGSSGWWARCASAWARSRAWCSSPSGSRPGHRQPAAPAARGVPRRARRPADGTRPRGRDHRAPAFAAPPRLPRARTGLRRPHRARAVRTAGW